jgi:hypothetical protein
MIGVPNIGTLLIYLQRNHPRPVWTSETERKA